MFEGKSKLGNRSGGRRIIIDSISSLESSCKDKDTVFCFVLRLNGFARAQGANVVLHSPSDSAVGVVKGRLPGSFFSNAMRLPSIADGSIVLRYVERERSVQKLLNVLKLRGSSRDKSIFQYQLGQDGFQLGGNSMARIKSHVGILTGGA